MRWFNLANIVGNAVEGMRERQGSEELGTVLWGKGLGRGGLWGLGGCGAQVFRRFNG